VAEISEPVEVIPQNFAIEWSETVMVNYAARGIGSRRREIEGPNGLNVPNARTALTVFS
jgi:hypothetical protein